MPDIGDSVFLDDGSISLTVIKVVPEGLECVIENSGMLHEYKGVNLPMRVVSNSSNFRITKEDTRDLEFALKHEVDYVSVGSIRDVSDVEEIRMILGNSKVKLLAIIENEGGIENYESILGMSDGIVIDRGYLGVEVELYVYCFLSTVSISRRFRKR
jgi:pyruvate kinase